MTLVLEATALEAGYGDLPVVRGVDIAVSSGEVVALLGPNGAGKTTTVMALAGALPRSGGTIRALGRPTTAPLHRRVREGMGLITEERSVFTTLSVWQNLLVGPGDPAVALALFPELERLRDRSAGLLSGGEQQMVTVARALAAKPALLFADELSLGLSPIVVTRLLEAIRATADRGAGVLLVEQHVDQALRIADRVCVMRQGEIALMGTAEELRRDRAALESAYLSG